MRLKVLLLVSLQTLGTRALYQFPSSSDNINSRDGKFDILSCADVCPLTDTIYGDREHNREIWNKAEVNGWFEIWLKAVPYSNWPNHIAEYIWPKQTPNFNCASLSGACKPMDDNCYHLCHGDAKQPGGYFLFYAAQKFHETANALHEFYQDLTIHTSFNLDVIISDWDGGADTSSDADVLGIMAACLGVASGSIGASTIPGAGTASAVLGALGGLFGIAAQVPGGGGGDDPTVGLKHLLDKFFTKSQKLLNKLLDDVFGNGNPKEIPESALTDVGVASPCTDNICRFFAGGKWLFLDIDDHISAFQAETKRRLRQALGVFAMNNRINVDNSYGYIVVINTDVEKGDCEQQDNMAHWTRGQCFNLFWYEPGPGGVTRDDSIHLRDVGEQWLHTFNNYGLSLDDYYGNVWDCATSHAVCHGGNHSVKWETGDEKALPHCFFHTRLVRGSYDASIAMMHLGDDHDVCQDR